MEQTSSGSGVHWNKLTLEHGFIETNSLWNTGVLKLSHSGTQVLWKRMGPEYGFLVTNEFCKMGALEQTSADTKVNWSSGSISNKLILE